MDQPPPIFVTKSFLPPIEEYIEQLKAVWESGQITNNGPLVRKLESELSGYLGVKHCMLVTNGDAGLRIALRGLNLTGDIVTTPFSYVSTVSSALWLGLNPVFADIQPDTLTIDPDKVEQAITPNTSAILATHVYGNPCDVERLGEIAKKHNLKLLYDAAHGFGVKQNDLGITEYGDISMISLHATKLFHSGEGGLLATNNSEIAKALEWRRRFGHRGPEEFHGVAINAKMTELNAAMGLSVFKYIDKLVANRERASQAYDQLIEQNNLPLVKPTFRDGCARNYSYYPVIFETESQLLAAFAKLEKVQIFPRRYFFPSLNKIKEFGNFESCPVSEDIAPRIACLPLSGEITDEEVHRVIEGLK